MKKLILAATVVILATSASAQDPDAPCTFISDECTEWVSASGGDSRLLVYRTHALEEQNEGISRALLMVHGGGRNADDYYRTALAATFLADRLSETVVIAPRFSANDGAGCDDELANNELNWPCDLHSWRVGSSATNFENVTSFDVVDEILLGLASNGNFPNLASIVVAGHSGGGAFTTHYQMANVVHDRIDVPITYVVANSPMYAYVDDLRPTTAAFPLNVAATTPEYDPEDEAEAELLDVDSFGDFIDAEGCTGYDVWPYGLRDRFGYTSKLSDEQLRQQLIDRPTTYLVGSFDTRRGRISCSRSSQGPSILARGLAFSSYVNDKLGASHDLLVVPACGHNNRCMFTYDGALSALFPEVH